MITTDFPPSVRLLDENLVSASARGELEALRYGIAMAQRS